MKQKVKPKKPTRKPSTSRLRKSRAASTLFANSEGPILVPVKIKVDPPATYQGREIDWTPAYQTEGSACVDLVANIPPDFTQQRRVTLHPRQSTMIDCGFSMALPPGYKAEVSARSGHAKAMLIVANAPGQVDSDFRGRVMVIVANIGKQTMTVEHGERFAQMWLDRVYRFEWDKTDTLPDTMRGEGGFGSTGRI